MGKTFILIVFSSFLVFFFSWLGIYKLNINTLPIQSEDTVPTIFLPLAILNSGTLYLDEFVPMMLDKYPNPDDKQYQFGMTPFYLRKVGEHYVSAFPIITALLAVPFYLIALALGVAINWSSLIVLAHVSASFIVAISAGLFFILLHKSLRLEKKESIILTFIYAFCTINFALVSQGLWQHGTVQLFTISALIFYLKFFDRGKLIDLAYFGFFMGVAVLSRPTAALPFLILSLYTVTNGADRSEVVHKMLRRSFYIGLGLFLPVLFFMWYNSTYYVSIENQGYANQLTKNWLGDFPMSFFGIWVSPSKGILIYSPIIIFSLLGAAVAIKKSATKNREFFLLCTLAVFLHTLIISFWKHWFGGWSFGYRMTSDVIPFIILLIVPWLNNNPTKKLLKVFFVTILFSFAIQLAGIVFFDGIWHAVYDRGYKDPRWLWSLKDSEFGFNARRTLVKFGYLDKACPTCAN